MTDENVKQDSANEVVKTEVVERDGKKVLVKKIIRKVPAGDNDAGKNTTTKVKQTAPTKESKYVSMDDSSNGKKALIKKVIIVFALVVIVACIVGIVVELVKIFS